MTFMQFRWTVLLVLMLAVTTGAPATGAGLPKKGGLLPAFELEAPESEAARAYLGVTGPKFKLGDIPCRVLLLEVIGVPRSLLPDVVASSGTCGTTKGVPGLPDGIPIYVDPQALREADKTLASTVSIELEGVPLRRSLQLVLAQVGLRYYVDDGILVITSEESEENRLPSSSSEPSPFRSTGTVTLAASRKSQIPTSAACTGGKVCVVNFPFLIPVSKRAPSIGVSLAL